MSRSQLSVEDSNRLIPFRTKAAPDARKSTVSSRDLTPLRPKKRSIRSGDEVVGSPTKARRTESRFENDQHTSCDVAKEAAASEASGSAKQPEVIEKQAVASDNQWDLRKLFKKFQKYLAPPLADPTRAFYESLLRENPDSKIAIKYCVEYGILGNEEHELVVGKYCALKEAVAAAKEAKGLISTPKWRTKGSIKARSRATSH
eukprot:TRINITY_DN71731_c0_g1_i1.p1 TRINITY_DN71731_c0_g1~~TRINITY_DN71731_c0_g1_i1.p1  ORF type:complete len:203 (+),score=33.81 TRINITY_DN71731_c0_g1_i1:117-725(+)